MVYGNNVHGLRKEMYMVYDHALPGHETY